MPSMSKVLVIIDIQNCFYGRPRWAGPIFNEIRDPLIKAIDNAKKNNHHILVVKHGECASYDVSSFLKKALAGYKNKSSVVKFDDDGSVVINARLKKLKLCDHIISICGVNTSQCIFDTVNGLIDLGYNVEVISEACADYTDQTGFRHNNTINALRTYDKLVSVI